MDLKNFITYGFVAGVLFSDFLATRLTEKKAVFILSSCFLWVFMRCYSILGMEGCFL